MNPKYYPYKKNMNYNQNEGDRFFFAAPFLFGALAGGAVASTTRPRPVFVSSPPVYNNASYPNPQGAYGSASYSYYYPQFRRK